MTSSEHDPQILQALDPLEANPPPASVEFRKTAIAATALGILAIFFLATQLLGPLTILFACLAVPTAACMSIMALCFGDSRTKLIALVGLAVNVLPPMLMFMAAWMAVSH
jgi:uncharacterized membrane protein